MSSSITMKLRQSFPTFNNFFFCQFSLDAVILAALFCHKLVDSPRKGLSPPFRYPFKTWETNGKTVEITRMTNLLKAG